MKELPPLKIKAVMQLVDIHYRLNPHVTNEENRVLRDEAQRLLLNSIVQIVSDVDTELSELLKA